MTRLDRRVRIAVLLLPLLISVPALLIHGPMQQDLRYHAFADQRSWLDIPNAGNVLTNALFLVVGFLGLWSLSCARRRITFIDPRERTPWIVFFAGVTLTAFGSTYYHLAPGNDRLFWDRLPMTLAFMSLLAAVIGERLSVDLGSRLLWPLLALGAASVLLWRLTENAGRGRGDVRLYGIVEFYPLVAIPLLLLLFPPRYTGTSFLVAMAGTYVAALLCEAFDGRILQVTGVVSGHSLKHAAAAVACALVIVMLARRSPLPAAVALERR